MIKATLRQVHASGGAVNLLNNTHGVKAKVSYPVSRLADALESEQKQLAPRLKKIFEDAGCTLDDILDGNGKPREVNGEKLQRWVHKDADIFKAAEDEAQELFDTEVKLNAIPIDFKNWEELEIPGAVWSTLKWACINLPGDEPAAAAAPAPVAAAAE